jgi:hypothetical protein
LIPFPKTAPAEDSLRGPGIARTVENFAAKVDTAGNSNRAADKGGPR